MSSKKDEYRTTKFAQSCDSRKCKSDNKDQIKKNFCEAVTTLHELNLTTNKIKCLDCNKITNI